MDSPYTHRLEKIEAVLNALLPETLAFPWVSTNFPALPGTVPPALVKSLTCIEAWDAPLELKNGVYRLWGSICGGCTWGRLWIISWHRDYASLSLYTERAE
ncbi:hypothetical protein AGMMS4952_05300 [Spirochaetia bacterium]|nr:hypothetical protein AGMMS4952_05300 [Spirochaetia bacterium]